MSLLKLHNTLESGGVIRYHAVPTVKPQSLAHHQWSVAMFIIWITDGACSVSLLMEALLHDTPEYFTGDVPFTVKRDFPDIKERFATLEDLYRDTQILLPTLPLSQNEQAILKLADTFDGLFWCKHHDRTPDIGVRWQGAFEKWCEKYEKIVSDLTWQKAQQFYKSITHE